MYIIVFCGKYDLYKMVAWWFKLYWPKGGYEDSQGFSRNPNVGMPLT